MIIRKLAADNLLKFERLELAGLPERGIIAVTGDNESGKSAILETICLALFGRSFALEAGQTALAVRWGAAFAGVEMEFTGRDGSEYVVVRHFDNEGRQRARFGKKRSRSPLRGLEAVNPAVREVVGFDYPRFVETLYLAQKRSEQPETAASLPAMLDTIRALAGVDILESTRRELAVEVADSQRAMGHLTVQEQEVLARIRDLGLDPHQLGRLQAGLQEEENAAVKAKAAMDQWDEFAGHLQDAVTTVKAAVEALPRDVPQLTVEEWGNRLLAMEEALASHRKNCLEHALVEVEKDPGKGLTRWLKETRSRLSDLAALLDDVMVQRQGIALWLGEQAQREGITGYPEERHKLQQLLGSAQRWQRLQGLAALLGGVAAGGCWAIWAEFTRFPGLLDPYWPKLTAALTLLDRNQPDQVLILASVVSALTVVWLGRFLSHRRHGSQARTELARLERRAATERQTGQQIDASRKAPLPERLAQLTAFPNTTWAAALVQWRDGNGSPLVHPTAWQESHQRLTAGLKSFQEEMDGLIREVHQQVETSRATMAKRQAQAARLREQIRQEEARHQEYQRLQGKLEGVRERQQTEQRGIRVRQASDLLLEGAGREMFLAFSQELRRHLSRILPLFTQGRFGHLDLDHALNLLLHSSEKEAFVQLAEISTGVQQQVLLAVRFALAQALVSRSVRTSQAVLMDEPFAYFDRNRLAQAIGNLGQISPDLVQFWITAQAFETGLPLDLVISCQQGQNRLVLSKKQMAQS